MTRGPASPYGFTLIELLVVIAVIAVLIGLLVPSIAAARRVAKRTVCLTHLHSWGLGFQMYAQDNDNWMCFQSLRNPNATYTVYQWYMWCGYRASLNTSSGSASAFLNTDSILMPYLSNYQNISDCPTLTEMTANLYGAGQQSTLPQTGQSPAYGADASLMSSSSTSPVGLGFTYNNGYTTAVKTLTVSQPGETFLLGDSASLGNTAASLTQGVLGRNIIVTEPQNPYGSVIDIQRPQFHARHPGGGNVVWYDGHATTEKATYYPDNTLITTWGGVPAYSSQWRRQGLGFLKRDTDAFSSINANYYFFLDKSARNVIQH